MKREEHAREVAKVRPTRKRSDETEGRGSCRRRLERRDWQLQLTVQPQIRRNNHRQRSLDRLKSTIDLPRHLNTLSIVPDVDRTGEGSLSPSEKTREDLTGLRGIRIDGLFSEEDEIVRGVGTGNDGLEELGLKGKEVLETRGSERSGRGSEGRVREMR